MRAKLTKFIDPKAAFQTTVLAVALKQTACLAPAMKFDGALPPLKSHLACLPPEAAMISAHRGTSRGSGEPENSQSGLQKLIKQGVLMAEVDVAATRDGTHFLYHDGVWDAGSTSKGPVAATSSEALDGILLKTREKSVSAERPPLLVDILNAAQGRIYLEIDFKSSAKIDAVVGAIRDAGMSRHVILITYSKAQAQRVARAAPDMLLSVPPKAAKPGRLVWVGKDITQPRYAKPLKNMKVKSYLGRVGRPDQQQGLHLAKRRSAILVTDHAPLYLPITGLTRKALPAYQACLDAIAP